MRDRLTVYLMALCCAVAATPSHGGDSGRYSADCSWSGTWDPSRPHADRTTVNAVPPTHKQIMLDARPRPGPGERFSFEGPTVVSVVVDNRGRVADARIVKSAATPPWPKYEASLLKAIRKLRFQPATLDGAPITFCDVLLIKDVPTPP